MKSMEYNGITLWKSFYLKRKAKIESYAKRVLLLGSDIIVMTAALFFALWVRFDGRIFYNPQAEQYLNVLRHQIFIILTIKIFVFCMFKMYTSIWKYASIREATKIVIASLAANIAMFSYLMLTNNILPRSIYIMALVFDTSLIGFTRFTIRGREMLISYTNRNANRSRVMIIGGGQAGSQIIKELSIHSKLGKVPVVVIDDNIKKLGMNINNVPIMGTRNDIARIADEMNIDEIIFAIPSLKRCEYLKIVEECKKTKCKLNKLPALYEIIDGKISVNEIKEVDIEDLLGRNPVKVDIDSMSGYLKDKVVLVTGGGGSIGSELCRQIIRFNPKKLLILDIYENNVYDLLNELIHIRNKTKIIPLIASVRDKERVNEVMEIYKPQVVFHAAAHKHVPLMEANPHEAIKNNVFGTMNVVEASDKHNVEKFILISTDKAVNPTNVMGATKRIAEMIVQTISARSKTEFAAVRFGNVLGSNGSVVPLFKKQIAKGGPVTVTHSEVTRFFMTIPEAVQLVLQAGSMAKGGEVFVLNMGKPVKILDLAETLIKLSGFEPYEDIAIEIVGLRPGEKLYEELLMKEEGLKATDNDTIFIGQPLDLDYIVLKAQLEVLTDLIAADKEMLLDHVEHIVDTYERVG